MDPTQMKQLVGREIDRLGEELKKISLTIHANPELGYQEKSAAALLSGTLEQAGFQVERGTSGLDTAFVGRCKGKGRGPLVAIVAEYDALPDIGHGCGHNIIATSALGASLGLKQVMESIDGSLMMVGTPAEERVGGKITMVKEGLFDGVSAALMLHPRGVTQLARMFTATARMEFVFHGKSTHAAASPDQGINALDACIGLFNGTNALRKHLQDGVRLHGVILEGGTAANIVPDRTHASFSVRAKTMDYLEKMVIPKVRACAEGAAMMAGATVEIDVSPICPDMRFNHPLSEAFGRNATSLGHDVLPMDFSIGGGSTDMGAVSQVVPAIHPFLKVGDSSLNLHTREFQVVAGTPEAQEAMLQGAKILAMTAIDVWTDPDLLKQAWDEFRR